MRIRLPKTMPAGQQDFYVITPSAPPSVEQIVGRAPAPTPITVHEIKIKPPTEPALAQVIPIKETQRDRVELIIELTIKALSVQHPWAEMIAKRAKTLEVRTWSTNYRGDLLICVSKFPECEVSGQAIAVVKLVDCRPMTEADVAQAHTAFKPGLYVWVIENVRQITPFKVSGRQGIFDITVGEKTIKEAGLKKPAREPQLKIELGVSTIRRPEEIEIKAPESVRPKVQPKYPNVPRGYKVAEKGEIGVEWPQRMITLKKPEKRKKAQAQEPHAEQTILILDPGEYVAGVSETPKPAFFKKPKLSKKEKRARFQRACTTAVSGSSRNLRGYAGAYNFKRNPEDYVQGINCDRSKSGKIHKKTFERLPKFEDGSLMVNVDASAVVDADVELGAGACVGPKVEIMEFAQIGVGARILRTVPPCLMIRDSVVIEEDRFIPAWSKNTPPEFLGEKKGGVIINAKGQATDFAYPAF